MIAREGNLYSMGKIRKRRSGEGRYEESSKELAARKE